MQLFEFGAVDGDFLAGVADEMLEVVGLHVEDVDVIAHEGVIVVNLVNGTLQFEVLFFFVAVGNEAKAKGQGEKVDQQEWQGGDPFLAQFMDDEKGVDKIAEQGRGSGDDEGAAARDVDLASLRLRIDDEDVSQGVNRGHDPGGKEKPAKVAEVFFPRQIDELFHVMGEVLDEHRPCAAEQHVFDFAFEDRELNEEGKQKDGD